MELVTLDSESGSSERFQPVKLIEDYESLIWTERYSTLGDFELISFDIAKCMRQLPLESYVGLRESTVPMIIESHKITKPKGKAPRVTVKGSSFEKVLNRRASVSELNPNGSPPRSLWKINADKVSDAAYKAMRQVLGDVSRANLPAVDPFTLADRIPEINLPLPVDYTTGTPNEYEIKAGELYSVIHDMLEVNHHAIRAVRPRPDEGKTTVDLEIYNGADLTESVVFDAKFDQFDDASYLFSYEDSKGVAYVYGPNGASIVLKNTGPEPEGLARRVVLVDDMSDTSLNSEAVRLSRGLVELYNHNAIALFDGETAIQVAQRFNKPIAQGGYGLGDILKLNGEYGLSRYVRVAEFIRSADASGEKAYPAFQVVDE